MCGTEGSEKDSDGPELAPPGPPGAPAGAATGLGDGLPQLPPTTWRPFPLCPLQMEEV